MAEQLTDKERKVLEAVTEWAPKFQAGEVKLVQLMRRPSFGTGERFGVKMVSCEATHRSGPAAAGSERTKGGVWATSTRAFFGNGPKVFFEWSWERVTRIRVLPTWNGVAIEWSGPGGQSIDVVQQHIQTGRPDVVGMAADFLKFEAAFADYGGQLDQWLEQLPGRLHASDQGGGAG